MSSSAPWRWRMVLAPIGLSTSFSADADGDTLPDPCDLCPTLSDPSGTDTDGDTLGDLCDPCPWDALNDSDGDGFCEVDDNCPLDENPNQADLDGDRHGDLCDAALDFGGGERGGIDLPRCSAGLAREPSRRIRWHLHRRRSDG